MEKYNTLKNRKDFECFISKIEIYLEDLVKKINKDNLIFDEDEINLVSNYFIEINKKGLFDNEEKRKLIVYFGEAFKNHFGGEWDFTGLESDSFAKNEPVITKFENEGIRMSPSEWIFVMLEKDDSNHFNNNISYKKDFQKKADYVFAQLFPKKKK